MSSFRYLHPLFPTLSSSSYFQTVAPSGFLSGLPISKREEERRRERERARGPLFRGTISRSEIPVGLALIVVEMERVAREGLRKDCGVIMKYRLVPLRIRLH